MSSPVPTLASMRPRTPLAVIVAVLAAFATLLAVSSMFLAAIEAREQAGSWVRHTLLVQQELEKTLRLLADAETGQRGYLLTDRVAYREPYDDARTEVPRLLQRLRMLTRDNPRQQVRLDALEPLVAAKLAELEETLRLHEAGDREGALARVRTDEGKATMDRIRDLLAEIRDEEEALLAVRTETLARERRNLVVRMAGGLACVGGALGMVVVLLSVAGRDAARREAHFRGVFEAASEGIWILDAQGRVTMANPAMARMLGFRVEELLGRVYWDNFLFPEDVATARALFERRRRGISEEADLRFRHRSGAPVWTLLSARSIQGPGGRYTGALDFYINVTERRRAEQRSRFLASLGARLLELFDPTRILEESTLAVQRFLEVDRCTFEEVDAARGVLVRQSTASASTPAERPLAQLGERLPRFLAGDTLVVDDTLRGELPPGCPCPVEGPGAPGVPAPPDPAPAAPTAGAPTDDPGPPCPVLDTRAYVLVPRLRDGRCVAALCVANRSARAWAPGEVELVSAVADRVWLAVENARLQEDLARRFEELDALYTQASVGLAFVDRACRFVRVNEAFSFLDGLRPETYAGRPVAERLPEVWAAVGESLHAVLAGGEVVGDLEITTTSRERTCHWLVGCYPVCSRDGAAHGAGLIVQDITARTHAEEHLRERGALLVAIAEAVPDLLFAKDRAHRFTLVNPAVLAAMGRPASEVIGHAEGDWMPDPEQARAIHANDERIMAEGVPDRVEEEVGPEGHVRVYQSVKVPLRDDKGEVVGLVGVGRDITRERHYARTLERTVTERTRSLSRSLASLEQLLYSIAHDLRAPNRAVHSFAELLEIEYADRLDARAHLYLDRIKGAALRNDELILDLLAYGRLAHADVPLAPVDLAEVVRDALLDLEVQVGERGARVQVHVDPAFPRVCANRTLLKQVLVNLVGNGLKYVPPERVPEVEVSAAVEGRTALIRVTDNGIGIESSHLERVFEPFARLAQVAAVPGTGMGLAIVQKAAERMNGEVGVESRPGAGSCFWVRLPLVRT